MNAMAPSSASHRSALLLLLVATATRGLSYSRGNLNEIGLACFSLILGGLLLLFFIRGPWVAPCRTEGGIDTWRIALPAAFVYAFAVNSYRYLLAEPGDEWKFPLGLLSAGAAVAALPVGLLGLERWRQRISPRTQMLMLALPLAPALLHFLLTPWATPTPMIDVFYFQLQAAQQLLAGVNPYTIEFVDVYGGHGSYPGGVPDSYPYPPLSFLVAIVGTLLGDVRWPLIACHAGAAVLLGLTGRARGLATTECVMLAALFFWMPYGPFVAEQAWTDSTVVLALAALSWFVARDRERASLWAAGAALAAKQTMALLLPLLWAWRRLDRRAWLPLLALPLLTYGIFLVWDGPALYDDVVRFHLETPFRARALTYSAYINFAFGDPLPSWLGLVGLAVGTLVAVLALRRADTAEPAQRMWRLWAGFAFAYTATALLSKHAFMNYYYVVVFLLVSATLWSRIADDTPTRNEI